MTTILGRDSGDPFLGRPAVDAGTTSHGRLRGPGFVRLGADLYLGAGAELDVRARVLAVHEWTRRRGVVAGPLAALAYGAECPWDDAEVVVPGHRRTSMPGVRTRSDRLEDDEVAHRWGVPLTTPLRTAFDLARRAPLDAAVDAVAAVDALAFRCGFGAELLAVAVDRHPHLRGIVQARRVLTLMDERAQSPMETRMRLLFGRTDLPAAVPQHRVFLPDGRWKDLDLAWPRVPPGRRPLGLEYDGEEHRTVAGQNNDRIRDGELDDVGWETIRVSSAMVYDDTLGAALVDRVRRRVT